MITKKERQDAELVARSLYQDVLNVNVKEDPADESSLLLIVTRGKTMPPVRIPRKEKSKSKNPKGG